MKLFMNILKKYINNNNDNNNSSYNYISFDNNYGSS